MDASSIPLLVVLVFLLILSGFFSSAETALTMVSRTKMMTLAQDGNKRALWVLKLIDNPSKLLSTILIGNNIANLSASSITTVLVSQLGGYATGIATGILTLLILIFGEITPKTLATTYTEKLSLLYAPVVLFLFYILTPVIWILNKITDGILFLLHINPSKRQIMTEKELRLLVDESHEEGVIEKEERQMINNVFDFGDRTVSDVMTPRVDMVCVDVKDSYDEIIALYAEHKYTRMPVYEDSSDNIIGVLNIKDLFYEVSYKHSDKPLKELLWEPYFTTEYQKTSDLMAILRNADSNMAIVLDEYGAISGLVTIEDLLEEIVGELRDEYDKEEENDIIVLTKNQYEVEGSMRLDDVNDALNIDLHSDEYDSLGGHIIELLDHFPKVGEIATEGNLIFKVTQMEKNRIQRVQITILEGEHY